MFVRFFDQKKYPNISSHWDDSLLHALVERYLCAGMRGLDAGAGAGILQEMDFKDKKWEIWGIDEDERVLQNPFLDKAVCGSFENMPFDSHFFDIVICNNVLEHLVQPSIFFQQIQKILKKDGFFIAKTPNKNHYMPLIARLTPMWFHRLIKGKMGKKSADVFPTLYLSNTIKEIRKFAIENNFEVLELYTKESRPEYMRWNILTYLIGYFYERFVNYFDLENYKIVIYVVLKKK